MFLVGLTGGIATGKSTTASIFREKGCTVIDADEVSREIVDTDKVVHSSILRAFGPSVFNDDGSRVDRDKLGDVIFSDAEKRKTLNEIVHPIVIRRIAAQLFSHWLSNKDFVILDTPLLFESDTMVRFVSETIVVTWSTDKYGLISVEFTIGSGPWEPKSPREVLDLVSRYTHHMPAWATFKHDFSTLAKQHLPQLLVSLPP